MFSKRWFTAALICLLLSIPYASGVRFALSTVSGNEVTANIILLPGTQSDNGFYYGAMSVPAQSEWQGHITCNDGSTIPVIMGENGYAGKEWYQWFRFTDAPFPAVTAAQNATLFLRCSTALHPLNSNNVAASESLLRISGVSPLRTKLEKREAAAPVPPFTCGLKIAITRDGIYELSALYLKQHGVPVEKIDTRTLRVFEGNREIPISITNEQHRRLTNEDRILFYGRALRTPGGRLYEYTETNCYWLVWGENAGARAAVVYGARRADPSLYRTSRLLHADAYIDTVYDEKDEMMVWLGNVADQPPAELTDDPEHDLFDGGMWYRGIVGVKELTSFTFTCAAPAKRRSARVRIGMMGMSNIDSISPDHDVAMFINDKPAGASNHLIWDGQRYAVFESDTFSTDLLVHGENRITMQTTAPRSADRSAFDWIELQYMRGYEAVNDVATFKSDADAVGSLVEYTVDGFSSSAIDVWDVSTLRRFSNVVVEAGNSSRRGMYRLVFQDSISSAVRYFAQTSNKRITDPFASLDTVSTAWDTLASYDYIAVSTDSFSTELAPLLDLHRKNGLKAAFVAVEDIYNRFSGGITNPEAIRYFLTYLGEAGGSPHYLLLGGDCTHNLYKKDNGRTVVPTHLSLMPGWGPGADDGHFALVNSDLFPDCSVGRFPAQNRQEMRALVQKNMRYRENPDMGYWRDNVLLLGGGGTEFTAFNDAVAESATGQRLITRMDADPASGYYVEGVRAPKKIADYCNSGMYIVNFNGHGGGNVWSDNDFFSFSDLPLLHNGEWKGGRLPVVLSFTCLTGFFESTDYRSLGEEFLRRETDGAIAFYGASAYTSQTGNVIMNRLFLEEALSGTHSTIGDLIKFCEMSMMVRYRSQYLYLTRQYNLLGDPALPLMSISDTLRLKCETAPVTGALTITGTCHPVDSGEVRIALVSGTSLLDQSIVPVANGTFHHSFTLKSTVASQVAYVRAYAWNNRIAIRGNYLYTKDTLAVDRVTISPTAAAFNDTLSASCRITSTIGDDSAVQVFCMYAVSERPSGDVEFTGVPMMRERDGIWSSVASIIPQYGGSVNARLMLFFRVAAGQKSIQSRMYIFSLRGRPDCLISSPRLSMEWRGDSLVVPFTVQNIGNAPAAPFATALIWKTSGAPADTIGTVTIHDSLAPGAHHEFVISVPDTSGLLTYEVVVDPAGSIGEVTNNNRATGSAAVWFADLARKNDTLRIDSGRVTIVPVDSFSNRKRVFVIEDTIASSLPLATPSVWQLRRGLQPVKWYCCARPSLSGSDSLQWKQTISTASIDTALHKTAFMVYDTVIERWRCYAGAQVAKAKTVLSMRTHSPAWYSRALLGDNTPPELMVSVYGKTLATLDYAAKDRPFNVMLSDPSSILPGSVTLLLNKKKLAEEEHSNVPENGDLRSITVAAYPASEHRIDSLSVLCSDLAGNTAERTFAYLPGRALAIESFTCHPNPFTARRNGDGSIAKIRFAFLLTDIANSVALSIFTVSGKKIRTWSDQELIGYRQIEWDGRDHEGYRIANGTYYAKLTVKNDQKKDTKIIRIAKLEGF